MINKVENEPLNVDKPFEGGICETLLVMVSYVLFAITFPIAVFTW